MLFRIEDVSGFEPNYREYEPENYNYIQVDKEDIDSYIATEIRKQINCSNEREVLSYSKSLAMLIIFLIGPKFFSENPILGEATGPTYLAAFVSIILRAVFSAFHKLFA